MNLSFCHFVILSICTDCFKTSTFFSLLGCEEKWTDWSECSIDCREANQPQGMQYRNVSYKNPDDTSCHTTEVTSRPCGEWCECEYWLLNMYRYSNLGPVPQPTCSWPTSAKFIISQCYWMGVRIRVRSMNLALLSPWRTVILGIDLSYLICLHIDLWKTQLTSLRQVEQCRAVAGGRGGWVSECI